ncbi:MAG: hypothetical protein CVT64_04995 [Actinobacteria bacterium HGW-Actinobacteria-4]|nr:MAG: hypothetical protein CVT64_04995 [Actinobacteria bacterium HGW-Actinobacteria-4]
MTTLPSDPGTATAPYAPTPMLETDARTVSMLVHIVGAVAALLSAGTIAFVAPLVMWLAYRDRSALVDHQGKQNINLQLTQMLVLFAAIVLGIMAFGVGLLVTIPLWLLYWVYTIAISFIAGLAAQRGEYYAIPFKITFIR